MVEAEAWTSPGEAVPASGAWVFLWHWFKALRRQEVLGSPWLGAMRSEGGSRSTFISEMAAAGTSASMGCEQGGICRGGQPASNPSGRQRRRLFLHAGRVQLGEPAKQSSARRQALCGPERAV